MPTTGLLLFTAAYLLAVASPGPGIAALLARVLTRGLQGLPWYIAGFVLGDLAWFVAAAAGVVVLAQHVGWLFQLVKWAGVFYLLWLALRLWRHAGQGAGAVEAADAAAVERGPRAMLTGLVLTLGNPKVMVFFVAILPTVIDLGHTSLGGLVALGGVIVLVLSAVLTAYALAAAQARSFFTSPAALRRLHRANAGLLAVAAAAIATRH